MPAEQKNPFHRCPKREQVEAMRFKTESSRENKLLFKGTILVPWKNLCCSSPIDLCYSSKALASFKASFRQDTAAPALRPHAGLFAALQSLLYDLWLLSSATWGSCQLIVVFKQKKKQKNYPLFSATVPAWDKQARNPSWGNLPVDSWRWPLSAQALLSPQGNSTWAPQFMSHTKFCFEQHWRTSRVISMKMKVVFLR